MKYSILSMISLVLLISCNSTKIKPGKNNIPVCVQKDIDSYNKKEGNNPPIQIDEYQYAGKRAFLYTADCCDQFNQLVDENCVSVCAPSGGIEGGGDHKCEDFSSKATLVKNIWKAAGK